MWHNVDVTGRDPERIIDSLAMASGEVVPAPGREPWAYGWGYEGYRRSGRAALPSKDGPVTLTAAGLAAFESAMVSLLRESAIRSRWNPEEFWRLVSSLIVAASSEPDKVKMLELNIGRVRTAGPALTLALVANVIWARPPMAFGNAVIGNANRRLLAAVNDNARGRCLIGDEIGVSWLKEQVLSRRTPSGAPRPVAMACWTDGQGELAIDGFERQLRNLVDLSMLLERDLKANEVFRRGDANRPGIRGLKLDRGAVQRGMGESGSGELGSVFVTTTNLGTGQRAQWFGTEPFPLGKLLGQIYLERAVRSCLADDPMSNRIRVAARWFSEAFYSTGPDDASLALGVAMDALVSGQRALPGSAMADRFALLSDDPQSRGALVKEYLDLYSVRSSVAHGGHSSKLGDADFLERYMSAVHWAAWRSLALRNEFAPSSEKSVDFLFNDLRWGVRAWPRRSGGRLYGRAVIPSMPRGLITPSPSGL